MRNDRRDADYGVTRRRALTGAAATFCMVLTRPKGVASGQTDVVDCVLTPEAVQGPFYFDPNLVRADISEGKQGAALKLTLQVVNATDCAKLTQARVDVWQADGLGAYSGYSDQETGSTLGETFLRGTQFTDADGQANFQTIYPGWYPGRTPHIHFKVFLDAKTLVTGQLYFPDAVTDRIYTTVQPYPQRQAKRDTENGTDYFFGHQSGAKTLVDVQEEGQFLVASLKIGVAPST